jgi:hypothetical protein
LLGEFWSSQNPPLSALQFEHIVLAVKDLVESGPKFVGVDEASIQGLNVDNSGAAGV